LYPSIHGRQSVIAGKAISSSTMVISTACAPVHRR
jgi:hypothetical protein